MSSKITLYWNEYINRKNYHISINYSIFILPEDSIVNTMCQLLLIPSNRSIINSTKIDIDIEKGNYKVAIIASVIDKDLPFTNMYDILYLKVSKRLNIILIIVISSIGLIIILIVLILFFRKKRKFIFFKRDENASSSKIENKNIINNESSTTKNDYLSKDKINTLKNEEMSNLKEKLIKNNMENEIKTKDNNQSFKHSNNDENN